jgi:hypothetical protein
VTVDPADHRLRQCSQAMNDHRPATLTANVLFDRVWQRSKRCGCIIHTLQIIAGAERPTRTGQHNGANVGISFDLIESVEQFDPDSDVQRIETLRPIEGDPTAPVGRPNL